jgi:hypothetical protein
MENQYRCPALDKILSSFYVPPTLTTHLLFPLAMGLLLRLKAQV